MNLQKRSLIIYEYIKISISKRRTIKLNSEYNIPFMVVMRIKYIFLLIKDKRVMVNNKKDINTNLHINIMF